MWRRHANAQLASGYAALFLLLDAVVYLRAPDLAAVRRWRLEQEAERPSVQRMNAASIERFVEHYERITRDMLARPPGWAVTWATWPRQRMLGL